MTNRVLFLAGAEFEDLELFYPYYRLKEEGYEPVVASKEKGRVTGKHGYSIDSELTFAEVRVADYGALVIPGGRGPENIRTHPEVKRIVREFFERSLPVAAICHGPQVLISAGVVKGRTLTSYYTVADDLVAAGADYRDQPLVVDGNLVSSRRPDDLPEFVRGLIQALRREQKSMRVKAQ
jgi:protease I